MNGLTPNSIEVITSLHVVFLTFSYSYLWLAGMFRPSNLVCSIQGIFNVIKIVDGTDEKAVRHCPPSLVADVRKGMYPVRSYK